MFEFSEQGRKYKILLMEGNGAKFRGLLSNAQTRYFGTLVTNRVICQQFENKNQG